MTRAHHGSGSTNLVRNKDIVDRKGDPLPQLLDQLLARAGMPTTIEQANSRPWASALFEGRRHVIRLRFPGADYAARVDDFITGIESAEWTLSGHFVADISIDDGLIETDGLWLELSALTIEDW